MDTTEGRKPPGTDLINRYLYRLNRVMNGGPDLTIAWADVISLRKPAPSLFHPRWVWRVMRGPG